MLKLKNKCRILESGKEKYEITYKLAADFSEKNKNGQYGMMNFEL